MRFMMDQEDDASYSSSSSASSDRAIPNANGRHSPVTVAAAAPRQNLTLAIPIQQARASGGSSGGGSDRGGGSGREDCWSEGATSALIDAWGERYLELSRGNLRQKHWQEVADIVNARDDYTKPSKTDAQCKNRIDTLKKKYKLEKVRTSAVAGPSKWAFFKRLESLIGPSHLQNKIHKPPAASFLPPPPAKATAVSADQNASAKIPMAIPVGTRPFHQVQKKNQAQLPSLRPGMISSKSAAAVAAAAAAAAAVAAPPSPDSSDRFPPETANGKKRKAERDDAPPRLVPAQRMQDGREGLREMAKAILKFGQAYERVESSKLQQMVEMEKQRMGFAKELELQRMQFFMKAQMELTQLKRRGRVAALASNSNSDDTS